VVFDRNLDILATFCYQSKFFLKILDEYYEESIKLLYENGNHLNVLYFEDIENLWIYSLNSSPGDYEYLKYERLLGNI